MKTFKFIIFLFFVVLLVSCKRNIQRTLNDVNDKESADLPVILKQKELKVLFEYSPTSFYYFKKTKMGFEHEMLKAFCKDLGVKLKVEIIKDLKVAERKIINGDANLLSCSYTITKERRDKIDFSIPYLRTPQVLIQRLPTDSVTEYIKDPIQLTRKKIIVAKNSSYEKRLLHLQEELGDTIYLQAAKSNVTPEGLMRMVSSKKIDYTVVDNHIAVASAFELKNLDHHLRLGVKQQIAFGLKKDTPLLRFKLTKWLRKFKKSPHYRFLKEKYFHGKELSELTYEDYLNSPAGSLSAYDKILKVESAKANIEWQLVAAIVKKESNFMPYIKGQGGAFGLMQFMPSTGIRYGVTPQSSPINQIKAGVFKIKSDLVYWGAIPTLDQRIKFVLASYNAGSGPVIYAQQRAKQMGLNPLLWDGNVEKAIGGRIVGYVNKVYGQYASYKLQYE